jgi:hypothetical protein
MVACGVVGYGLGSLVGIAVPLGLVGFFAGLVVGFALVYARFSSAGQSRRRDRLPRKRP